MTITGTLLPGGIFDTYYVGPTSDEVLAARPTPVNAADYIALLHDLEYKALGLNGITGVFDPKSRDADYQLIQIYNSGGRTYCGYPITPEAYDAAIKMGIAFGLKEATIAETLIL